jgi:hypothetical protein
MNESKAIRLARLLNDLAALGFTYAEANRLRRIEMTLSRWSTAECNGEIVRDEETGKPSRVSGWYLRGNGPYAAYPIPDRETGARKQLAAIMAAHPDLWSYNQGDPRGVALYVGRKADLKSTSNEIVRKARSWGAHIARVKDAANQFKVEGLPEYHATEEAAARAYLTHRGASIPARNLLPLDQHYNTRGVAVHA